MAAGGSCSCSGSIEITENANGLFTGNGTQGVDEPDLAATRQPHHKYAQIESQRVHIIWDLFAVVSILTFVADIASDLAVSVLYYFDGSYLWFSLTLGFVLLSSIVMQVFSAKWFHEDDENQNWCAYLLHLFHLGPLVRYWRLIRAGCRTRQENSSHSDYEAYLAEWRDISMLRLFECFLESAPQLVLQLYIMAYNRRFEIESDLFTAFAAGSSLISLAWAIAAYTKALRDFSGKGTAISWIGFFLQIVWRMCMVASRVVALVLFASYYTKGVFVAVGVHWFIMTAWLVCQRTRFCVDEYGTTHWCREYLFNSVIGFVYVFCFFNIKEGMTRIRVIPYYVIMLGENTIFIVMWYPFRTLYGDIETAAFIIVWGGFACGLLCMVSYYCFYHPSLSVKGICVKKTQLNVQQHQHLTVYWCCCCKIQRNYTNSEESDKRWSIIVHQRPSRRNTQTGSYGNLQVDIDIVPRMSLSREQSANGVISGIQANYQRTEWL